MRELGSNPTMSEGLNRVIRTLRTVALDQPPDASSSVSCSGYCQMLEKKAWEALNLGRGVNHLLRVGSLLVVGTLS